MNIPMVNIFNLDSNKLKLALTQYGKMLRDRKSFSQVEQEELQYLHEYKPLPKIEQRSILTKTPDELDQDEKDQIINSNLDLINLIEGIGNANEQVIEDLSIQSDYEKMYNNTTGITQVVDNLTPTQPQSTQPQATQPQDSTQPQATQPQATQPTQAPNTNFDGSKALTTTQDILSLSPKHIVVSRSSRGYSFEEVNPLPTSNDIEDIESNLEISEPDLDIDPFDDDEFDSDTEDPFDDEEDNLDFDIDDEEEETNPQPQDVIQEQYEQIVTKTKTSPSKPISGVGRNLGKPTSTEPLHTTPDNKSKHQTPTTPSKPVPSIPNIPKPPVNTTKQNVVDRLKSDYINNPEVIPREVKSFVTKYRGIKYSDAKMYIPSKELDRSLRQGEIILKSNRLW